MKRLLTLLGAAAIALTALPAAAQDKLVVSIWGGSWRDMVAATAAKKFTADTGVPVEFITGGTIDRLNKAKLAKGNPESDINFTTSHVGWLYANDDLYETLDLSKVPNAKNLVDAAKISPYHIGTWAYVYTIGYRSDLIKDMKFDSWADLWKPEMKGKLAAPDFDPSHIITIAAMLSGADAATWEKGQDKLKALKPSFKAFYTNDANSQQLLANGETPVQVVLSMNAHFMVTRGRAPHGGDPQGGRHPRHRHGGDPEGHEEGRAGLQVHQHRARSGHPGRSRQDQEGQPGGGRRQG